MMFEQIFKSLVENTNDIIMVMDATPPKDGGPRIVYVNPAFETITGYRKEEIAGEHFEVLSAAYHRNQPDNQLCRRGRDRVQIKATRSQTRCIVLDDSIHQQQMAEAAGADAALIKGYRAARLAEVIERLASTHTDGSLPQTRLDLEKVYEH